MFLHKRLPGAVSGQRGGSLPPAGRVARRSRAVLSVKAFGSAATQPASEAEGGKRVKPEKEKVRETQYLSNLSLEGAFVPTREGYLRFLAESKAVYDVVERIVAERDEYAAFRNSGLERAGPLAEDIAWFTSTYGLQPPTVTEVGVNDVWLRAVRSVCMSNSMCMEHSNTFIIAAPFAWSLSKRIR
eukprot:1156024-Pelagomonas_calceolata.AAC.2